MDQFSRVAKKYVDKGLIAGLEWEIRHFNKVVSKDVLGYSDIAVSYTHLTLPTIYSV